VTFRRINSRLEELGAQVLGISCDHTASHRAWTLSLGGVPYPELSDWHPKGKVSKAYDLWNEERGASIRAVVVIDKEGIIRFRETYQPGTLPDPQTVLEAVAALG
jgi:alkyl hydroperoxide reductase subunit AhpC